MSALLGIEPDIDTLLTKRNLLGTEGLTRYIVKQANISGLVMDFGYQADDSHTVDEVRAMLQGLDCSCLYVMRLETRAEQPMLQNPDFDRFMAAFRSYLI